MPYEKLFITSEIRTADRDGERYIEGHAAVFNQLTDIAGQFYEVIERGAFDGCDLSDVAFFVNHDTTRIPLARSKNGTGTLILWVDGKGLAFRASLDVENNAMAKDLYSSIVRGDIRGCSFAFQIDRDEWENLNSEMPTRHVQKIKRVIEISCATYPAYQGTNVAPARTNEPTPEVASELRRLKKLNREFKEMKTSETQKETRTQDTWTIAGEVFKRRDGTKEIESPFNIFGEQRAITLTNTLTTIAVPTMASTSIVPPFPQYSTLIDSVTKLTLTGGDSFFQPYLTALTEGDYTDEGKPAVDLDLWFGKVEISRTKVTAYAELSSELKKLPAADYAGVVFQSVGVAIRKFLSREIMLGAGNDERERHITGIFSANATAIDPATDLAISQITDTLLEQILEKYGGSEDVDTGNAVLIISKPDLLAFAKTRSSVKTKIHSLQFTSANTGNIDGVPFIINSACKPISIAPDAGGAQSGEFVMAFGDPRNYELVEFNPLKIERSDDFQFRRGLSCFRATAFVGGNCIRRNGFLRVKRQ